MIFYDSLLESVKNGETTFEKFTESIYEQIESRKSLNCFITLNKDAALLAAKESDARVKSGKALPLDGMIIAIKDNFSTKGIRTTCASQILENFEPIYNATAVQRVIDAGAILIGKTNMDEFAMGSSNETSYFGNVKNPLDETKVPGGSSGGSATATAAGFCHVAFGSDTGGSIRQPASFCGVYGLKPSYGRISRNGLIAFASSLDTVGLFASNANDLSRVLDVISGADSKDSTLIKEEPINSFSKLNVNPNIKSVGLISPTELEKCDLDIQTTYNNLVDKLHSQGIKTKVIEFEHTDAWIPTYYILATAECSSNLSRFDGVRFGKRPELAEGDNLFKKTRSKGFGDEVKRRIMTGTYVLSSGYYDAYYKKAQQVRRIIFDNYEAAFSEVDFILMPTTPSHAFDFNAKKSNPLSMYLSDFFTASANLAGIPAINVPAGVTKSEQLPYGIQLQAAYGKDEEIMAYANWIEKQLN